MKIASVQKFSLLDFPGKISCIVFTSGCNFRCGYCHNPELVCPKKQATPLPEEKFFNFLKSRHGKLDGVVITGGEPTLHAGLIPFISKIKEHGFQVKLDSNGTNPKVLKELFKRQLLDYLAMDIKSSPEEYHTIVDSNLDISKIKESKELIQQSGVPYEFRTTVVKGLHTFDVMENIGRWLRGASKYYLQNFRRHETLNQVYQFFQGFNAEELAVMQKQLERYVAFVGVRK